MVAWTGSADRPHSGVLTVVVWERWAHTSLSPLHRTTAVGAVKAAAEGDEAGTLHSPTQASRWRERVSVPTSSPRRTLTCPDIQPQTAARANPSARRERRRGELLALWLRDFFFFFFNYYHFFDFFFFTNTLNLGSQSCLLWERMGPLLLSIALCVSVAVPQHVKGEWEKWLTVITAIFFKFIYLFYKTSPLAWEYHRMVSALGAPFTWSERTSEFDG